MLGILDDYERVMTLDFKNEGDHIYLVGQSREDLGSSEYLRHIHKVEYSNCPYFDLEEEYALHQTIAKAIREDYLVSAHDVSDGGAFTTLVESAMAGGKGFSIQTGSGIRKDAWLFGEAQSRVIVSVRTEQVDQFERFLQTEKTPFEAIGRVGGQNIAVDSEDWGTVASWKRTYDTILDKIMH
jgi:phosphoribosylformylglycinamidine synthase